MFVFFKQKTAYEMRISDWRSDVCSSDLLVIPPCLVIGIVIAVMFPIIARLTAGGETAALVGKGAINRGTPSIARRKADAIALKARIAISAVHHLVMFAPALGRSEEHTSELQSLMRISYAVFCLKKKKEV